MKKRFLSVMLIVAMALSMIACNGTNNGEVPEAGGTVAESEMGTDSVAGTENVDVTEEAVVLGEGNTVFLFTVVDGEGNESLFEIHTDKEIVGEALAELGLIQGEESEYGLFVKTVNGITADYETDGTYWAFYINGSYAMSGVDTTPITEGEAYMFKVEKA